jgi:hypothetical protein
MRVLASESDGAQCPFCGRVVHFDGAIVEVASERTPTRECIAYGRSCIGLAGEAGKCPDQPVMEIIDEQASPCLADLASVVG